jgi:hypothetical protein
VPPGLIGNGALMLVTIGSSDQRVFDAACVSAICVTECPCPARVGVTFRRASGAGSDARVVGLMASGSASATGVPP